MWYIENLDVNYNLFKKYISFLKYCLYKFLFMKMCKIKMIG